MIDWKNKVIIKLFANKTKFTRKCAYPKVADYFCLADGTINAPGSSIATQERLSAEGVA